MKKGEKKKNNLPQRLKKLQAEDVWRKGPRRTKKTKDVIKNTRKEKKNPREKSREPMLRKSTKEDPRIKKKQNKKKKQKKIVERTFATQVGGGDGIGTKFTKRT